MKYALLPNQKEVCKRIVAAHGQHQLDRFLILEAHGLIAFMDESGGRDPGIEATGFELRALAERNLLQLSANERGVLQMGSITQELLNAVDSNFDLPATRKMPKYNLMPEQMELGRKLVEASKSSGLHRFQRIASDSGDYAYFIENGQPSKVRVEVNTDDLRALETAGLLALRNDSKHQRKINGGHVSANLVEAVENDFRMPVHSHVGGVVNYAPNGAIQFISGSQNDAVQNAGIPPSELIKLINEIRANIESEIDEHDRAEVNEYLDDLQQEISQPHPKQSRMRSAFRSLWGFVKDSTTIAANIAKIAEACGTPFSGG